jgi:hypothetical protein
MKTKEFTPVGSMHPVLFFVFIYVVALLFSVFICSSLFYSFHSGDPTYKAEKQFNLSGDKSISLVNRE